MSRVLSLQKENENHSFPQKEAASAIFTSKTYPHIEQVGPISWTCRQRTLISTPYPRQNCLKPYPSQQDYQYSPYMVAAPPQKVVCSRCSVSWLGVRSLGKPSHERGGDARRKF